MSAYLLFFKGHGVAPLLIRWLTWRGGEAWSSVPSHVAICFANYGGWSEYEATITGIHQRFVRDFKLHGLIEAVKVELPDEDAAQQWVGSKVGKPYGYLAVISTGLGIVSPPWWDRLWARLWEHLAGGRGGRTAPLDCSLLAQLTLKAGGLDVPGREDGLPVSPNDLYLNLKELFKP